MESYSLFWTPILFGLGMTATTVISLTFLFPVMQKMSGCSWKEVWHALILAPQFGLLVGKYTILPALAGAIISWLMWLSVVAGY